MLSERVDTDTLHIDEMHVVCPRAGGLDVHKMCITAAVRLCEAGRGLARTAVREFSALPDGLRAMTDWLRSHGVTAAAMEGTGVYWKAPFEALEDAGIHADLLNAQHVKPDPRGRRPMPATACGWPASASSVLRYRATSRPVDSASCAS